MVKIVEDRREQSRRQKLRTATYLLILPLSPLASQVLGLLDEVTLKDLRGTTTLEVYAAPVHFWQSLLIKST